jgi:predicted transcriptional regulator of viral defense system
LQYKRDGFKMQGPMGQPRCSYISFETALAYHGWIPERVFVTASVVPGRKSRRYENEKMGINRGARQQ